jgi:hypothetical protein
MKRFGRCEKEKENEMIENQVHVLRQVLKLSRGSGCDSLFRMTSDKCIEIDDSVEIITISDLRCLQPLKEVRFSSGKHLKEIDGFAASPSLCRIEIPSPVETIGKNGFNGCTSLREITFLSDSQLREISGFGKCSSLCRIDIPSSVERIRKSGFNGCTSLNEITFSSDDHLSN